MMRVLDAIAVVVVAYQRATIFFCATNLLWVVVIHSLSVVCMCVLHMSLWF
jgi:hypothetical protein